MWSDLNQDLIGAPPPHRHTVSSKLLTALSCSAQREKGVHMLTQVLGLCPHCTRGRTTANAQQGSAKGLFLTPPGPRSVHFLREALLTLARHQASLSCSNQLHRLALSPPVVPVTTQVLTCSAGCGQVLTDSELLFVSKSHVLPSLTLNECSLAKRLIKVTDIGIPCVRAAGKILGESASWASCEASWRPRLSF